MICCATCHGKHVGLLHVTFGPSVRSRSARHTNVQYSDGAFLEDHGFKSQQNHFRGQADAAAICQRKKVNLNRWRSRSECEPSTSQELGN